MDQTELEKAITSLPKYADKEIIGLVETVKHEVQHASIFMEFDRTSTLGYTAHAGRTTYDAWLTLIDDLCIILEKKDDLSSLKAKLMMEDAKAFWESYEAILRKLYQGPITPQSAP